MPQSIVNNLKKREYTDDDLQLIFDSFYDPEQRKLLPELLERSPRAIELQFYGKILKQRNMTVAEYYLSKGVKPPKNNSKKQSTPIDTNISTDNKKQTKETFIEENLKQEKEKAHTEFLEIVKMLKQYPQEVIALKNQFKQLQDDFFSLREEVDYTLKEFATGVSNISSLMLERETRLPQYRQSLLTIQHLQEDIVKQEEIHNEYVQKSQEQYFKVKNLLETLMNAPSFEKILKLEEFLPQIKYEINQWGQIVNPKLEI